MTVIAWDGKTLAGDKRTNFGGLHGTTTKIHRFKGCLLGCAGNTAQIMEMHQWVMSGYKREEFPAPQRDAEKCVSMLVIEPSGKILQYENTPDPIVIENKFWAIGSGRDYAMAAMHLGHSARVAAEVACALDVGCGNGVDTLDLQ
jgi:ATP-dependent protease HslVU (ClpYQ) peptidase subunit